jgi:hypothetical protein
VISAPTPYFALFDTTPSYAHLQVFGCACYPTTSTTAPYKLAPRSCRCVFLRYSSDHKGYRCLDLTTNHVLMARHVFDESSFPFASSGPPPDNLDSLFSSSPVIHAIAPPYPSSVAGISETVVMPCAAPAPQPMPRVAPMSLPTPCAAPTPMPASAICGPSLCHAWPRRPCPRHERHRRPCPPAPFAAPVPQPVPRVAPTSLLTPRRAPVMTSHFA